METPEGVQIVSTGEAEPNPDDIERAIEAQLPLFDNPRKAEYLANRACGFSIRESAALAEVKQHTISDWRRDDPVFAQWEGDRLTHLQTNLAGIVMRAKFMRNMMLGMIVDSRVLKRAAYAGLNSLSDVYKEYLLKIARKMYDPQALLALERACGEAPAGDGGDVHIGQAVVIVEGKEVTTVEAKQAAARRLLDQFTANRSKFVPDDEIVEGEVVDGNGQ